MRTVGPCDGCGKIIDARREGTFIDGLTFCSVECAERSYLTAEQAEKHKMLGQESASTQDDPPDTRMK